MGLERLIGFSDRNMTPDEVRGNLEFDGRHIRSLVNDARFDIGEFEFVSLHELRKRVEDESVEHISESELKQSVVNHTAPAKEDVADYIRNPDYQYAMFQVASQFNLLEMASPNMTPEHGIDVYWNDYTQGPACARATIGATLFRNYFVEFEGRVGQSASVQLNGLDDALRCIGIAQGDDYIYENGYIRLSKSQLKRASDRIQSMSESERMDLMGEVKVGIHWGCQANDHNGPIDQYVSTIFCSGLPLGYYARGGVTIDDADALGRLVQDAMQEATILASTLNSFRYGNRCVVLTKLGCGVFGNPINWVVDARNRALDKNPVSVEALQFHYSEREPEFDYGG